MVRPGYVFAASLVTVQSVGTLSTPCRYGGELLGPVRFNHIETCTQEVCRTFRQKEDMAECITTLLSLDDILATLRAELASAQPREAASAADGGGQEKGGASTSTSVSRKAQDYTSLRDGLDLKKARRLITARESSIRAVKSSLKKVKERQEKLESETHMGASGVQEPV